MHTSLAIVYGTVVGITGHVNHFTRQNIPFQHYAFMPMALLYHKHHAGIAKFTLPFPLILCILQQKLTTLCSC